MQVKNRKKQLISELAHDRSTTWSRYCAAVFTSALSNQSDPHLFSGKFTLADLTYSQSCVIFIANVNNEIIEAIMSAAIYNSDVLSSSCAAITSAPILLAKTAEQSSFAKVAEDTSRHLSVDKLLLESNNISQSTDILCLDSKLHSKRPRDLSPDHCGIFYVQKILKIYFK